ncbi:hypothetical protein GGH19_001952 [Coemansia sp. RSA 1807]|nr:hypothetical protein LPJ58_002581 [Coemansia sp. RSA 1591]KAJ1763368.1 hypothetical protein LPJ69_002526 [Coemansia sp. RSA 1752]KAJ1779722.1 hypothetical protein LPJ54_000693 [Coemansia sp. RSA 1824]KAJ1789502.1 hypothetical protein LPJ67_002472 [Coemansia sp. RSA 1938]KAJ1793710.1 hypothetical protein LPJ62_000031 [Coemansia sp. RSA 2167]KAJ2136950.1 hypothetical protein GGH17_001756 [Coemansia sp. RSA 788]KAJ2148043.1 hypothetical protein IW142_001196 [Coemansia sp. RSA 564]KAJ2154679.
MHLFTPVLFAAIALGAVIPETSQSAKKPMTMQIMVSSIDTNLSRFMPLMMSQVRMDEQRQALLDIAAAPTEKATE